MILENIQGLPHEQIEAAVKRFTDSLLASPPRRVLLIPPDYTRSNSGGGWLTRLMYASISPYAECDILPALGSHRPMSRAEQAAFFGADIPEARFHIHDWRNKTVTIGHVPAEVISALSNGRMNEAIPVEVNRLLIDGGYDAIISVGQVVPHEVAGMANYTKNIVVGCGGNRMVDASHLLSVYAGTEEWIGRDYSPVRRLFDYVQEKYLDALPLTYMLTVTAPNPDADGVTLTGLYIGGGRAAFEQAVALSQRVNITHTGKPVDTCVVYLPPEEFKSAWLGNKAVYRTRNALSDGARLIVLAPGFERFGEDAVNDTIIRRYGYTGKEKLLGLFENEEPDGDFHRYRSALAHLIHGSSDGRFSIRYCTAPANAEEIRAVGYEWGDIEEYTTRYAGLNPGWNARADGDVYVINNPALGLWGV